MRTGKHLFWCFFCSRQLTQIQKKTCKNRASQQKIGPSYFDRALADMTGKIGVCIWNCWTDSVNHFHSCICMSWICSTEHCCTYLYIIRLRITLWTWEWKKDSDRVFNQHLRTMVFNLSRYVNSQINSQKDGIHISTMWTVLFGQLKRRGDQNVPFSDM